MFANTTTNKIRRVTTNPGTSATSPICTAEQRQQIAERLEIKDDEDLNHSDPSHSHPLRNWLTCPESSWIHHQFYAEEANIGSADFLGISVGCNKGHDAIRTARMGMSNTGIDAYEWRDELDAAAGACGQGKDDQVNVVGRQRKGEMHCIVSNQCHLRFQN